MSHDLICIFAQVLDWFACISMQVRDSKVKFLKDKELGTVVHVHKPQKAQQQQQQQVGVQACCFAGGACQGQLTAALLASLACSITFSNQH